MKKQYRIFALLTLFLAAAACVPEANLDFVLDTDKIEIGPDGGSRIVKVSSSESWVASTQQPWITVSPANGRGSAECRIIIDTTLLWNESRTGTVYIKGEKEDRSFTITQKGYDYQIVLDKPSVKVSDYAEYGKRSFEVKVKTNVDFKIEVPDTAINFLKKPLRFNLNLDRGARPREVVLKFDWAVNSLPYERVAGVKFIPLKNDIVMGRHDTLAFLQKAALPIPVGTVEGDSLSLLAISRSLGVWTEYDTSERMQHWTGIEVWKSKDPKLNGRVKSASFAAFTTKEGIPYEVQYLTAAEELSFYGNTNTFLIEKLDCGPYICMLTELKRLTIGAYGMNSLHEDFKNLTKLEYLNLESNNFQTIPEVINEENFPNLHSLILNANTRYTVTDLSNDTRENIGGFVDEEGFPIRLLAWDNLDTLRLSANYLQGTVPSDEEIEAYFKENNKEVKYWRNELMQFGEHKVCLKHSVVRGDTFYDDNDIPVVLPKAKFFAINLNRLYGNLPNWLLWHPQLDLWFPDILVWSQEGKAQNGTMAKFDNAPSNMTDYYDRFTQKEYNPKNLDEDSDDTEDTEDENEENK